MSNVDVQISSHASPISAAYEYVGEDGPINIGDTVILGASTKGDDWKRWTGAAKYVKDGVELIPPESSAVIPSERPNGVPFSATDFRNALGNPENRAEIAEFVGEENVDSVLRTLGLEAKVDELSSNAGGGLTGGIGVPLASGSGKPKKRDPRKRNENIAIANEVMKLIKERGILR